MNVYSLRTKEVVCVVHPSNMMFLCAKFWLWRSMRRLPAQGTTLLSKVSKTRDIARICCNIRIVVKSMVGMLLVLVVWRHRVESLMVAPGNDTRDVLTCTREQLPTLSGHQRILPSTCICFRHRQINHGTSCATIECAIRRFFAPSTFAFGQCALPYCRRGRRPTPNAHHNQAADRRQAKKSDRAICIHASLPGRCATKGIVQQHRCGSYD